MAGPQISLDDRRRSYAFVCGCPLHEGPRGSRGTIPSGSHRHLYLIHIHAARQRPNAGRMSGSVGSLMCLCNYSDRHPFAFQRNMMPLICRMRSAAAASHSKPGSWLVQIPASVTPLDPASESPARSARLVAPTDIATLAPLCTQMQISRCKIRTMGVNGI